MLQVRSLSLRYPNGKLALSDFNLTVQSGELVVVLGGNGSGKTTLLRCLTRVLQPTAGEIRLGEINLAGLSGDNLRRARMQIAMVWQHASLVRRSSVLKNVAAGALGRHYNAWTAMGGTPAAELHAAHGYLAQVGLAELAHQRADTLSGGQAQRVAIARALAQRPGVMLADEPVASLDPEAAQDIMRLLQRLAREENLAVVAVLHQIELAFQFGDRVVGIREGRMAFDLPRTAVSRDLVNGLYLDEAA